MKFLALAFFWQWPKRLRCHGGVWPCDKLCKLFDEATSKKPEEQDVWKLWNK